MNYLLLNGLVLGGVSFFAFVSTRRHPKKRTIRKAFWYTLVVVLSLTAIFDSLIIASGIVAYNKSHILGIYIGRAPIEDFAYAIVSVTVVVLLWEYYDNKE